MEALDATVKRLGRGELSSRQYQDFIGPLFGGQYVPQRVDYLKWLLADNPALPAEADLPIYVYRDSHQPLGQLAVIPADILYGGRTVRSGWCIDFFVTPEAQRRGVGIQLLQAAFRDYGVLMTLGQTDLAYKFFLKHGWHDRGALTHQRTLLNLPRTLPKMLLRKAGLWRGSGNPDGGRRPQVTRGNNGIKVEICADTAQLDSGEPTRAEHSYCALRGSRFLQWRYLQSPFARYHVLSIRIAGESHAVLAAMRFYRQDQWMKALLVDLLYPQGMSYSRLKRVAAELKRYAMAEGAEQFECKTSDDRVLRALAGSAFTTCTRAERFLCGHAEQGLAVPPEAAAWKLFAGDCDVDTLAAFQASIDGQG